MRLGDNVQTNNGRIGVVVGFPRYGGRTSESGVAGHRRVQILLTCRLDDDVPIQVRAAYDPRDLRKVSTTHD